MCKEHEEHNKRQVQGSEVQDKRQRSKRFILTLLYSRLPAKCNEIIEGTISLIFFLKQFADTKNGSDRMYMLAAIINKGVNRWKRPKTYYTVLKFFLLSPLVISSFNFNGLSIYRIKSMIKNWVR